MTTRMLNPPGTTGADFFLRAFAGGRLAGDVATYVARALDMIASGRTIRGLAELADVPKTIQRERQVIRGIADAMGLGFAYDAADCVISGSIVGSSHNWMPVGRTPAGDVYRWRCEHCGRATMRAMPDDDGCPAEAIREVLGREKETDQ